MAEQKGGRPISSSMRPTGGDKAIAGKKQYFRRKKLCRFCVEKVDDITAARNPSGVQLDYSFVPNLLDADAAAPDPSQAVVGKPAADPAFHQIYLRYIGPCARTVIEAGHVRCLLR